MQNNETLKRLNFSYMNIANKQENHLDLINTCQMLRNAAKNCINYKDTSSDKKFVYELHMWIKRTWLKAFQKS